MLTTNNIKNIKSLQQKKYRTQVGLFVAEGHRLVSDLLNTSIYMQQVYFTPEWGENVPKGDNRFVQITAKDMGRISGLKTPATVIAIANTPKYQIKVSNLKNSLTIALDNIQDPGNLGTIIRLADWFGIGTIISSPDTADAFSPKVVQSTMGAIARVKVIYTELTPFLKEAVAENIPIYGSFLNGSNIYGCSLPQHGIVILGNEGNGISKELETLVEHRITIPSFTGENSTSESLNVAVAAAIICSEFRRRTI